MTLGSQTLLLLAAGLCPEEVSTMLCPFSFKAAFQRYNILEMDDDGKTPEQKFSGVAFQIFPTDYHTWEFPVFVIESSLYGALEGLTKWDSRAKTGVYIENSPLHSGSVTLVLNTTTGNPPHPVSCVI